MLSRSLRSILNSERHLLFATRTAPRRHSMRTMSSVPACLLEAMRVPQRELFGPGPSNMAAPIQASMGNNLLGHLHPEFVKIMSDVREGLQYLFGTSNAYTFAVSGTGHAGMEAALLNLLERGEKLLVVENGIWGQRAADLGRRLALDVHVVKAEPGHAVNTNDFEAAVSRVKPSVVFVCHGESSTGVAHPLEGLGDVCRQHGALLLVDTVASLGGARFHADRLGVDCVYSATQKVLNAPPGLAPISFSDRAMEKIRGRKERVASFYFDALELGNYWGCDAGPKRYHHTAPISCVYALREALAVICSEGGVDKLVEKHEATADKVYAALEKAGLEPFVQDKKLRLPCLTTVRVPEGVDWKACVDELLAGGVEIAGGLGPTAGKVWRIGTFGGNSHPAKAVPVVEKLAAVVGKHKSNI